MIFNFNPWWLALALSCVALMAFLGYKFVNAPNAPFNRRTRALLWSARCLAVLLILFCCLDPRSVSERETRQGAHIQVIVDDSSSMYLPFNETTRAAYAQSVLDHFIVPACKKHNSPFSLAYAANSLSATPNPDHARTTTTSNIISSLDKAIESNPERVNAILLLSDGRASDTSLLQNSIKNLQSAKIPVFCWPIGDARDTADSRILSASLSQPGMAQPRLRLQTTIESSGLDSAPSRLNISYKGQQLASFPVTLKDGSQDLSFEFDSPFRGLNFYDITLEPVPSETQKDNNSLRAACELLRDPIRILYMEGSDPSEVTYLKDALESDQDFEVDCLHFPSQSIGRNQNKEAIMQPLRGNDSRVFQDLAGRPVPSVCHPTQGFPRNLSELLHYDVVIVSDIIKEAFTPQQHADMVSFVEQHGGGFVMIGGDTSFGAGGYEKTKLEKLMPIEVGVRNDHIWHEIIPVPTAVGWQHPIMQVGDTPAETQVAWTTGFPGFGGTNYVRRAKPGAITLSTAIYPEAKHSSLFNFLLFAVQDIGAGRTMAFTSDSTAGWGDRFEKIWGPDFANNKYYSRFWNNAARWLASSKIAAKNSDLSLQVEPQAMLGSPVEIKIPASNPSTPAELKLTATAPDGTEHDLTPNWSANRAAWSATFKPDQPGDWKIKATCRNSQGRPSSRLCGVFVNTVNNETTAISLNSSLLSKLSSLTNASLLDESNCSALLNSIAGQQHDVIVKSEHSLWDRWWILLIIASLICAEWIVRRSASRKLAAKSTSPASPRQHATSAR